MDWQMLALGVSLLALQQALYFRGKERLDRDIRECEDGIAETRAKIKGNEAQAREILEGMSPARRERALGKIAETDPEAADLMARDMEKWGMRYARLAFDGPERHDGASHSGGIVGDRLAVVLCRKADRQANRKDAEGKETVR
jgi:hypothetical protein